MHIFSWNAKDLFDHTNIDGLIRNGRKQCSQHTSGIRKELNVFGFYVITCDSTTQKGDREGDKCDCALSFRCPFHALSCLSQTSTCNEALWISLHGLYLSTNITSKDPLFHKEKIYRGIHIIFLLNLPSLSRDWTFKTF